MDKQSNEVARARWQELVNQVAEARERYYQDDRPTLADADYDSLFAELQELEEANPDLRSGRSPTQSVGGNRAGVFEPVSHLDRLLSLDDVFNPEELRAWVARLKKDLPELPALTCELKIDGLAVDLVYLRGQLVSMATRGDGRTGEDVTFNAQFMSSIPKRLDQRTVVAPEVLEVRGEVFFGSADFAQLNIEMTESGRTRPVTLVVPVIEVV